MANEDFILAVDVPTEEEAVDLAKRFKGKIKRAKVGLELIHAVGSRIITSVQEAGDFEVFYDCKLPDIPNTMKGSLRSITERKPWVFNLMASSGPASIKACVENRGDSEVWGVTVLTSISVDECIELHGDEPRVIVPAWTRTLIRCGADGVICSPQEVDLVTKVIEEMGAEGFKIATPGIRFADAAADDQARVMTPFDAIRQGVTYPIIGRPVRAAADLDRAIRRVQFHIDAARAKDGDVIFSPFYNDTTMSMSVRHVDGGVHLRCEASGIDGMFEDVDRQYAEAA
jgi:orotidine-5'-phosphate decarboxylase